MELILISTVAGILVVFALVIWRWMRRPRVGPPLPVTRRVMSIYGKDLLPGELSIVKAEPVTEGGAFLINSLLVSRECGCFTIRDIRIGGVSQMASEHGIPAFVFIPSERGSGDAFAPELVLDVIRWGTPIEFHLVNDTDEPKTFMASAVGTWYEDRS